MAEAKAKGSGVKGWQCNTKKRWVNMGTKEALVPFGSTNWAQPCGTEMGRVKKRWSNIGQSKLWSWFHELGPPTMTMVLAMVTATMAGKEKLNKRWTYRLHGG